jgi:hypothetical protein
LHQSVRKAEKRMRWKPTKIRDAAIWFGLAISAALAFFFL